MFFKNIFSVWNTEFSESFGKNNLYRLSLTRDHALSTIGFRKFHFYIPSLWTPLGLSSLQLYTASDLLSIWSVETTLRRFIISYPVWSTGLEKYIVCSCCCILFSIILVTLVFICLKGSVLSQKLVLVAQNEVTHYYIFLFEYTFPTYIIYSNIYHLQLPRVVLEQTLDVPDNIKHNDKRALVVSYELSGRIFRLKRIETKLQVMTVIVWLW